MTLQGLLGLRGPRLLRALAQELEAELEGKIGNKLVFVIKVQAKYHVFKTPDLSRYTLTCPPLTSLTPSQHQIMDPVISTGTAAFADMTHVFELIFHESFGMVGGRRPDPPRRPRLCRPPDPQHHRNHRHALRGQALRRLAQDVPPPGLTRLRGPIGRNFQIRLIHFHYRAGDPRRFNLGTPPELNPAHWAVAPPRGALSRM